MLLAFPALVSEALKVFASRHQQRSGMTFPLPLVEFLRMLSSVNELEDRYCEIAEKLESDILGGTVVATDDRIPEFFYLPTGMQQRLPMHVSSSIVTELAPIVTLLKSGHLPQHHPGRTRSPPAHQSTASIRQGVGAANQCWRHRGADHP